MVFQGFSLNEYDPANDEEPGYSQSKSKPSNPQVRQKSMAESTNFLGPRSRKQRVYYPCGRQHRSPLAVKQLLSSSVRSLLVAMKQYELQPISKQKQHIMRYRAIPETTEAPPCHVGRWPGAGKVQPFVPSKCQTNIIPRISYNILYKVGLDSKHGISDLII